ncbi:TPA: hypothetical protein KZI03_000569 [Listeria monocytogenes]|nr:hypothetical protein [Listeria monocytogenes]HBI2193210.1 hypothetical protein [Listeria monocytogenes]
MKAKEYLLQISKIDRLVENKIAELEHWQAIATGTTTFSDGDRVQSTGNKYKMEDAIIKCIEISNDLNIEIDRLVDTRKEVISTIEQLKPSEYDVLHKIYVQNKDFQEIATAKKMSYSWVTSKHGRALASLQKILDEREKNEEI